MIVLRVVSNGVALAVVVELSKSCLEELRVKLDGRPISDSYRARLMTRVDLTSSNRVTGRTNLEKFRARGSYRFAALT